MFVAEFTGIVVVTRALGALVLHQVARSMDASEVTLNAHCGGTHRHA